MPVVVVPQVPTIVTSVLGQSVITRISPRWLGSMREKALSITRFMGSRREVSWNCILSEGRPTTVMPNAGKDVTRNLVKDRQSFWLSPRKVPCRQVCSEASSTNVDQPVEEKESFGTNSNKLTLKELCNGLVPQHFLEKAEEVGFKYPTQTQEEALPVLLSGVDCLLHAQTGSGKTLAYLLPIFTKLVPRSSVQAIVVVPTRELGMQVAKVARTLLGKSSNYDELQPEKVKGALSVMTLLDGGSASRQKKWIKAAPPQLIVGTLPCLSRLIDSHHLRTNTVTSIVIDEVDTLLGAAKEGNQLQKLLTVHTQADQRQTIFASATVPQHSRFIRDCIQNKWAKEDLVHIHVSPKVMMPSYLQHRYVVCDKQDKLEVLIAILSADNPRAAIIFVNESEKAKRAGEAPSTTKTAQFLSEMIRQGRLGKDDSGLWEPLVLEEDDHINQRTSTISDFRDGRCLLVATDLAARGLDLPEVSHVYNVDLPPDVTSYIHRAGRTGRRPIEEEQGLVTNFIIHHELFVLRRIENESQINIKPLHIKAESYV